FQPFFTPPSGLLALGRTQSKDTQVLYISFQNLSRSFFKKVIPIATFSALILSAIQMLHI
ncbi:MAG: hypothetical protein J1F63_04220, partial [Oscillospiraceae bacterium]|nr:hypothetical protein [Oscillospiraceae bacterium]